MMSAVSLTVESGVHIVSCNSKERVGRGVMMEAGVLEIRLTERLFEGGGVTARS